MEDVCYRVISGFTYLVASLDKNDERKKYEEKLILWSHLVGSVYNLFIITVFPLNLIIQFLIEENMWVG